MRPSKKRTLSPRTILSDACGFSDEIDIGVTDVSEAECDELFAAFCQIHAKHGGSTHVGIHRHLNIYFQTTSAEGVPLEVG